MVGCYLTVYTPMSSVKALIRSEDKGCGGMGSAVGTTEVGAGRSKMDYHGGRSW